MSCLHCIDSRRWCGLVCLAALAAAGCGSAVVPNPSSVATAEAATMPPPPPAIESTGADGSLAGAEPSDRPPADAALAAGSSGSQAADAAEGETPRAGEPPAASDQAASEPPPAETREAAAAPDDAPPVAPGPRPPNPFGQRVPVPEFSKKITWLNTEPLTIKDLKGKFVLFDFWTYCCINCMHILPELKKLEREFPNNLVVIGVHSAKFEAEQATGNIRDAIMRYEIEHPVINDADHSVWNAWGVSSWPTIVLIDPEGMGVWGRPGEFKAGEVRNIINAALPYYREQRLLDEKPLKFALEAAKEPSTPLRFPGKILADEKGNRLFISDSNHNRIVIATLDGRLLDIIGSGAIGRGDGDYQTASFDHPQGCALSGNTLYVADTENHLLRKVHLKSKSVTTVAGTGEKADNPFPGWDGGPITDKKPRRWVGPPMATALNSPWAVLVHQQDLFIAMAGCHQIWRMPLDESEIGPHAGNAREDIVDGDLVPKGPFLAGGAAAFAQPSGLSSDGTWLYVADSEGSSIRKVPFKHGTLGVGTVVGSDHLPAGQRLFAFGDRDGPRGTARLQHCLDVDYLDGKIFVADTYNHKIKVVAKNGDTKTLAGSGKPGSGDDPAEFHEPAGLTHAGGKLYVADTNNHLIRTIDLATGKVATLTISGLEAPANQTVAAP